MNDLISIGTRVEFDSEHGTQRGTVLGLQTDITNGQSYAVIAVDHTLAGCAWKEPLNKLQLERKAA